MRPDTDPLTVGDLRTAIDVDQLRDLLAPATRRGERVSRSYAGYVARGRDFPEPVVDHPKLRLWLRHEVLEWVAANVRPSDR